MPQVTNSYLGEDFFNAPKGLFLIQYNKERSSEITF